MVRLRLSRKLLLVCVGFIVLVAALGVISWIRLAQKGNDGTVGLEQKGVDTQVKAADFLAAGDPESGLHYYDEQIRAERVDEEKQLLLVYKSSYALMAKQFDAGIAAAKEADDMGSNALTVRALAEAYAASGNKEQAIVYYRKLLEMSPDEDEGLRRGPSVEDIIRELEQ